MAGESDTTDVPAPPPPPPTESPKNGGKEPATTKEPTPANLTQKVQAACNVITAAIALLGLYVLNKQLGDMTVRQTDIQERLTREDEKKHEELVANLHIRDNALQSIYLQYPELRVLLYHDHDGKKYTRFRDKHLKTSREQYDIELARLKSVCVMHGNFWEYFCRADRRLAGTLKHKQMLKETEEVRNDWDKYMKSIYGKSYYYRQFLKETFKLWDMPLQDKIKECIGNEKALIEEYGGKYPIDICPVE